MSYSLDSLQPEELEKLAFFLLDDMGFKNLEWRKGSEGISATDGGRDLSGVFTKVEPDDSLTIENWWVEVKYRSNTLKKSTVQDIVVNSSGFTGVDVVVIFTNNVISNSTLDWVKEFQKKNSKPRIVIWQKHDIERILRKYPKTASIFFPGLQTLPEQIESIKQRFWNNIEYPTIIEIERVWSNFQTLNWDGSRLLPFIIADSTSKSLSQRKWGFVISKELLLETLILGLINVPFFVIRFNEYRLDQISFMKGLEYLLQIALIRLDYKEVVEILLNLFDFAENSTLPTTEKINYILQPLINNIFQGLLFHCSKDCERFCNSCLDEGEYKNSYFSIFLNRPEKEVNDKEPHVFISLNMYKCKLGLVPINIDCPIITEIPKNIVNESVLTELLTVIHKVIKKRVDLLSVSSP
ncbi:MAG: restriction endonuclease [Anaerolineaceae bacterium]|nr:restriction endonuclease [Anaerolineaceae bacterium]